MESPQSEDTSYEWRWCLVGNIVDTHAFGQDGETRIGTKHFRPGAKVYCSLWNWGDGGEHYPVIGLPRHGKHLITVVMPSKYITNFRIQKVFNPAVLKEMERDGRYWFSNSDKDRDDILRYLKSCEDNGLTIIKNEIWDTYAEAAGRFPDPWFLSPAINRLLYTPRGKGTITDEEIVAELKAYRCGEGKQE